MALNEMKLMWRRHLRSALNAVDRAEVTVHAEERVVKAF